MRIVQFALHGGRLSPGDRIRRRTPVIVVLSGGPAAISEFRKPAVEQHVALRTG
ncbi:MAG: hypothetical protein M3Z10_10465 [Gemmatimonadota bacterium]|nr:hypothetical protein [Gemmatimonadota bacterium]